MAKAYEDGYRITTTITRKVQQAAQQAVRNNVMDYDMRHGYRGPSNVLWKVGESSWDSKKITDTLKALPTYGPLLPAVVTSANPQEAIAALADGTSVSLRMDGMRWARPYRSDTQQGPTPRKVTDVVQTGQQIWVRRWAMHGGWRKCQTSTPHWSPSTRKTARCWRWWVVLTSTRASLTVQPGRYVRWAPTSSHSCIPPRWIKV